MKTVSFEDLSELSRADDRIRRAIEFVDGMDATASLESVKRGYVQKAIRKLRDARDLILLCEA